MKVGLSFSRCILDLLEGRVNVDEVLVIIARTNFDMNSPNVWADHIWRGHRNSVWSELNDSDEHKVHSLVMMLWNRGLIHQPRKFGAWPDNRREIWLETILPSSELETNHAAREAWENFQVIAGLADVGLDEKYY